MMSNEPGRIFAQIYSETIKKLCAEADKAGIDRNDFIQSYREMFTLSVSMSDFEEYSYD